MKTTCSCNHGWTGAKKKKLAQTGPQHYLLTESSTNFSKKLTKIFRTNIQRQRQRLIQTWFKAGENCNLLQQILSSACNAFGAVVTPGSLETDRLLLTSKCSLSPSVLDITSHSYVSHWTIYGCSLLLNVLLIRHLLFAPWWLADYWLRKCSISYAADPDFF